MKTLVNCSSIRRAGILAADIALALTLLMARLATAQTYTVIDVSAPGGKPSFATGVNAGGQVSGYSTVGAKGALAWRFTPGTGTLDLGSFGGADSRALGINDAGQVTGYATDAADLAHGFVFSDAGGLTDIGGNGGGAPIVAQHLNAAGQVVGFSSDAGDEQAFRFSPPSLMLNLGTLPNARPQRLRRLTA